jgi:hypothetical protein
MPLTDKGEKIMGAMKKTCPSDKEGEGGFLREQKLGEDQRRR